MLLCSVEILYRLVVVVSSVPAYELLHEMHTCMVIFVVLLFSIYVVSRIRNDTKVVLACSGG